MPFLFNRGATMTKVKKSKPVAFDTQTFLYPTGMARKALEYQRKATIFAQGDPSTHVMYAQKGAVKFSVINEVGKEAIIAMLGAGVVFGEGCLAGENICQKQTTAY